MNLFPGSASLPRNMNRFKNYLVAVLAVGALMAGALAFGQQGGQAHEGRRFGGGFMGGGSNLFLLRRSDVQTDLRLTSDQKTKLDDLMTSMRGNRGDRQRGEGGQPGTPPTDAERQARRAQMESRRAEMEKNVNAILTPAQVTRLKEISLQIRGNMALMDTQVQSDLGLTAEQKNKISGLRDKMQEATQTVMQKMQDNTISRDDAMNAFKKNSDIMKTELGKVLTSSQAEKFKSMQGAPFKADPSESGFGFGFGRGGGRRGGGGGSVGG